MFCENASHPRGQGHRLALRRDLHVRHHRGHVHLRRRCEAWRMEMAPEDWGKEA